MKRKKGEPFKRFSMRIPHDMWLFYRKVAFDSNTSMMEIIVHQLEKFQRKSENKSLQCDTQVSE